MIEDVKFDLKLFQIDKSFYELRGKTDDEIIRIIQENHEKKLRHNSEYSNLTKPQITEYSEKPFAFWSYCFNQRKEKSYWKLFLPDKLTENQNFEVIEFSFVLFIQFKDNLYCVISGSGMNVIKKYVHPSFGIEVYQRLSSPTEDNVIELNSRGIANNISLKRQTFNFNQTISETLEYSEVPTKIKLKVRNELKQNEFKYYDLDPNLAILEVGSYFLLRKKIDFETLKKLILDVDTILKEKEPVPLTLFTKIDDPNLLNELDNTLKELVAEDVLRHNDPRNFNSQRQEVIEVVHPSKLERFYECDNFLLKFKFSRGKNDIHVKDRSQLYYFATKHIFDSLTNINDKNEAKGKLYDLNITGQVNDKDVTFGNLFMHITAEIEYLRKKYFRIDGQWFILEDQFLDFMNNDAKLYYQKYRLNTLNLKPWDDSHDEEKYNASYHIEPSAFVLDRIVKDNIELCDVLIFENGTVYLIHVKDGFDAKMRDLYVQLVLSAKRLSNDLKNAKGSTYLRKTLTEYNKRNSLKKIDVDSVVSQMVSGQMKINFVMAFKSNHYKNSTIMEKIDNCKSNIAKYALVQVVKEMQAYNFSINLMDLSEIS